MSLADIEALAGLEERPMLKLCGGNHGHIFPVHIDTDEELDSYCIGVIAQSKATGKFRFYPKRSLIRTKPYDGRYSLMMALNHGMAVFETHLESACRSNRIDHPDIMTVDCLLALEYKRRMLEASR